MTLDAIRRQFFADQPWFDVGAAADSVPVVAARLSGGTRSFSEGQRVYVYDGFFGQNERVKVVGRYRRKHRFIRGVCPMQKLIDPRLVVVYQPAVLGLLEGQRITLATLISQSTPQG